MGFSIAVLVRFGWGDNIWAGQTVSGCHSDFLTSGAPHKPQNQGSNLLPDIFFYHLDVWIILNSLLIEFCNSQCVYVICMHMCIVHVCLCILHMWVWILCICMYKCVLYQCICMTICVYMIVNVRMRVCVALEMSVYYLEVWAQKTCCSFINNSLFSLLLSPEASWRSRVAPEPGGEISWIWREQRPFWSDEWPENHSENQSENDQVNQRQRIISGGLQISKVVLEF